MSLSIFDTNRMKNTPETQSVLVRPDESIEVLVRLGQVRLVYDRLPLVLGYTAAVSVVFATLLRPVFPGGVLWPGLIVLQLVSVGRAVLWVQYRRAAPESQESRKWIRRFMIGTALAAAAWSLWIFPVLLTAGPTERTMLLITLLAVSAVGVSSLAPYFPSLCLFLSVALGPAIVHLLLAPDLISRISGWAIVAAVVTLAGAGWRMQADIRRMLRTELELSEAMAAAVRERQAADAANAAKSVFLANMSHEVRTPLNGILGLSELLSQSPLDPERKAQIGLLRTSTTALLDIVNDILDFSKIEAGKVTVEQVGFDLPGTVRDVAKILADRAEAKGLTFRVIVDSGIPAFTIGDPGRLRQVLINLGGNAVKFTHQGTVEIRVEPAPADAAPATVRFTVSDTGIGIPPQAQAQLFQPFTQADNSTTRPYAGIGLGLSIAQRLVRLMGGSIGVASAEGRGSTFWFDLSLPPATAPTPESSGELPAVIGTGPPSESQRILVVEDHEINQLLALEIVRGGGYEVDMAANGEDGVTARFAADYGLIFMDCQMPIKDGFEATRAIRERERTVGLDPVPIVALTANAVKGDRERCLAAGMNDYLPKPFTPAEMLAMIHRHLGSPAPADLPPPIDVAQLAQLVGGDQAKVRKFLGMFVEMTPAGLRDLAAAVNAADGDGIIKVSHKLKGSAAMIGARPMADLAEAIEHRARAGELGAIPKLTEQLEAAFSSVREAVQAAAGNRGPEPTQGMDLSAARNESSRLTS
ncbi:MAG: ATP-binding protein [Gemmatimonadales bacterium]